jgi:hypothetical protein
MSWGSQNDFVGTGPPTPGGVYSLLGQVKISSLLSLNAEHCAIGDFGIGAAVKRDPDRKTGRRVVADDLNARYRLASWPLLNCRKALLAESCVGQSNRVSIHHYLYQSQK